MTTADEKKTDAAETSTVQNNENDANGKGDASDKGDVNSKGDASDKDCVNCEDCASREGNETKKRRDSKRRGFIAAGFGAVALFAVVAFFIGGAAPEPPTEFAALDRAPTIYPDYCDVTIPPNVAPLNFDVQENAEEILTRVFEDGAERPVATFSGKEIRFSQRKWRRLLERNVGKTLRFETFALNVVGDSANGEKTASVGDSTNGEKAASVGDSTNGKKPASVGDSANGEKAASVGESANGEKTASGGESENCEKAE
ncbi:MAG: hypothetical protein IJO46_07560, partial [Thermoguttaceae bacterium]|nr:hypothetical protein [Thermoguttaceae bacterium]